MKQMQRVYSFVTHRTKKDLIFESGRSMVEILGVMAVIGVLSIVGLMGYQYAMNKYRANDIINEVNLRVQDIWHKYQNIPLPDTFNEYANTTQTGFPIQIISSGNNLTFSIDVNNVPDNVCKQVLSMGLNNYIIKLIRVMSPESDSEEGLVYHQDVQICETYGEISKIRFLATLEQLGNESGNKSPIDSNGDPTSYCFTKSDCPSVANNSCFECINNLCQPDCPLSRPYCNTENTTNPSCETCLTNVHCPTGYICDESSYTCKEFTKKCANNEFRTYNGTCIPCTTYSNIRVSEKPFEYKVGDVVKYKDEESGKEMCENRCAGNGKYITKIEREGDEPITYCAYTCVDGYSYQSVNGCIKCADHKSAFLPTGVDKAKEQCLACGYHWIQDGTRNELKCLADTCPAGKMYSLGGEGQIFQSPFLCLSLAEARQRNSHSGYLWTFFNTGNSDSSFIEDVKNGCLVNNSKYVVESNGKGSRAICLLPCDSGTFRRTNEGSCISCTDPGNHPIGVNPNWYDDQTEGCLTCGRYAYGNYCKPACTKGSQWVSYQKNCYSCSSTTTDTRIDTNGTVDEKTEELCTACGRKVYKLENGQSHCLTESCREGQFRTSIGRCQDCSYGGFDTVITDEDCTTPCDGQKYSKRYIVHAGNTKYCYLKCSDNTYYQNNNGACQKCTASGSWNYVSYPELIQSCKDCGRRVIDTRCELQRCPTGYWQDGSGDCQGCSTNYYLYTATMKADPDTKAAHDTQCTECVNSIIKEKSVINDQCVTTACQENYFLDSGRYCRHCNEDSTYYIYHSDATQYANNKAACLACGNRLLIGDYCVKFVRGTKGICNDFGNGTLDGYSAGNGIKYRGADYLCYECTKDNAPNVGNNTLGREQCESCGGNRQFVNGKCLLGHCTSGIDFMTLTGCQKCSFNIGRYEIAKEDSIECKECDNNKFVQQVGNGESAHYYCINKPDSNSFITADGSELPCTWSQDVEIGVDIDSINACHNCNRQFDEENNLCLAPKKIQ